MTAIEEPMSTDDANGTPLRKVSADEVEVILIARLGEKRRAYEEAIWELVRFYSQTGRQELAKHYVEDLMSATKEPERNAEYWMTFGQLAEQVGDYEAAIEHYTQAYSLEPAREEVAYFVNNNLGYSLLQLGQPIDAEPYLRRAIEIDPKRYNAHKNLGLSLQGQGKHIEAAWSLVNSALAYPLDGRALDHLTSLISETPELLDRDPELRAAVAEASTAGRQATAAQKDAMRRREDLAQEPPPADKIILAVAKIVLDRGSPEFRLEELQAQLGCTEEAWSRQYAEAFQSLLEREARSPSDKEGESVPEPPVRRIRDGSYVLTDSGVEILAKVGVCG